jgi:hypothetical protein
MIDSLDHYIRCEKLHSPINKTIRAVTGIDLPNNIWQNIAIPLNDPTISPVNLACVFKAHVVLDVYQMIAGRQRKGTVINSKLVVLDLVKEGFRKLGELTPWAHHIKKL